MFKTRLTILRSQTYVFTPQRDSTTFTVVNHNEINNNLMFLAGGRRNENTPATTAKTTKTKFSNKHNVWTLEFMRVKFLLTKRNSVVVLCKRIFLDRLSWGERLREKYLKIVNNF